MVIILQECGADVNRVCGASNNSALHLAAQNDFIEIAEILIKKGSIVNAKEYSDDTPLHDAASSNHILMMKLLLAHGAEIDAQNEYLETPLQVANHESHVESVQMLLKCGANPYIKDHLGDAALEVSLKLKYNNIFKTIVYHQ